MSNCKLNYKGFIGSILDSIRVIRIDNLTAAGSLKKVRMNGFIVRNEKRNTMETLKVRASKYMNS